MRFWKVSIPKPKEKPLAVIEDSAELVLFRSIARDNSLKYSEQRIRNGPSQTLVILRASDLSYPRIRRVGLEYKFNTRIVSIRTIDHRVT